MLTKPSPEKCLFKGCPLQVNSESLSKEEFFKQMKISSLDSDFFESKFEPYFNRNKFFYHVNENDIPSKFHDKFKIKNFKLCLLHYSCIEILFKEKLQSKPIQTKFLRFFLIILKSNIPINFFLKSDILMIFSSCLETNPNKETLDNLHSIIIRLANHPHINSQFFPQISNFFMEISFILIQTKNFNMTQNNLIRSTLTMIIIYLKKLSDDSFSKIHFETIKPALKEIFLKLNLKTETQNFIREIKDRYNQQASTIYFTYLFQLNNFCMKYFDQENILLDVLEKENFINYFLENYKQLPSKRIIIRLYKFKYDLFGFKRLSER